MLSKLSLVLCNTLIWFLLNGSLFAQTKCTADLGDNAGPKQLDSINLLSGSYIQNINTHLVEDLENIDSPYEKEIKESYEKRVEKLSSLSSKGHFFYDADLLNKINEIGDRLIAANDIKNKDRINWVLNRTGNPNASCVGEGTLIINLGLISNLHNLEQLAFVMAHELGHYHLDHVNKKIEETYEFLNSEELQKKIENASNDKEMAAEELLEMLDEKSLSISKHSRDHEVETDKLGFEFYTKAGFPADQAVEALKVLKHIDKGKYPSANFSEIFGDLDQVWKPTWTKTRLSGLSLVKPDEAEIEKYRTHPETTVRIEQLLELGGIEKEASINQEWCQMAMTIDLEILEYSYWIGDKFDSFVFATQLFELNQQNEFVNNILANCLADFVIAKEEHTFSNIVPFPNIKMSDHHFDGATFLDNINFSALKKIALAWIEKNVNFDNDSLEAINALAIKMQIINKNLGEEDLNKFTTKWPDSHYLK